MALPLEGIRVLDMTIFQQGTYSTAMLADLGADVIKIEGPDSPDLGRWSAAVVTQEPPNSYFQSLNRSKRGICIDLKQEKGRRVFHKLVEEADVFVSNMRRPALKRLEADYETLSQINPSLVYGRASGYGPNGPDADLGGMDVLGQARGGIMSMTGDPDRSPKPAGVAVADHVGAMSMAFGLMVALFHRERTGEGQEVDASLLGGQMCIQTFNITDYLWSGKLRGRVPRAGNNPTWSIYKGSDDKWFCIGMNRERYWPGIREVLGKPDWITDDRFGTLSGRMEHREELFARFDELFSTRPAAEWIRLFSDADLLATPVNDYSDVAQDPQVLENGYITDVERGDGEPPLKMVGLPVIFSKTPGRIKGLAPEFGQHTEEVLLESGFTWDDIEALRAAGAIGARAESVVDA
jgi:crotonobetainyl-CoA:carnitine CoA-transferase CaiB-like acyl-CoA transferase